MVSLNGQAEVPWGYYITQSIIGYGNLYSADFSGTVNCFDLTTGALKWTYKTGDSGYELLRCMAYCEC